MTVHRRSFFVFLLVLALVAVPVAAWATVPAVSAAEVLAGDGPAEEAPPEAEEEEEKPWTQRYLAPTVLLIGALALGGSILYYAVGIRARYRVKN